MKKKILYIDMDGVIADFDKSIIAFCPEILTDIKYQDFKTKDAKIDFICETETTFFHNLLPFEGAILAVNRLFELYEVYFLSTPIWDVPHSFTGKRIWIEKYFGALGKKKLILTHRKDLNIGDYLVDDRLRNGAGEFKGKLIHFGTDEFPNWEVTLKYLEQNNNW
jgi:5'-nucleotidase